VRLEAGFLELTDLMGRRVEDKCVGDVVSILVSYTIWPPAGDAWGLIHATPEKK
jgi:hypothetical protein